MADIDSWSVSTYPGLPYCGGLSEKDNNLCSKWVENLAGYAKFSVYERAMTKPEITTDEELVSYIEHHITGLLGYGRGKETIPQTLN